MRAGHCFYCEKSLFTSCVSWGRRGDRWPAERLLLPAPQASPFGSRSTALLQSCALRHAWMVSSPVAFSCRTAKGSPVPVCTALPFAHPHDQAAAWGASTPVAELSFSCKRVTHQLFRNRTLGMLRMHRADAGPALRPPRPAGQHQPLQGAGSPVRPPLRRLLRWAGLGGRGAVSAGGGGRRRRRLAPAA